MSQSSSFLGYYRRLFVFACMCVLLVALLCGVTYRQLGGHNGARYWMAGRALDALEVKVLRNRPDDISVEHVTANFQIIRNANREQTIDLDKLYSALRSYQTKFWRNKPSNDQVRQFLSDLANATRE